MGYTYFAQEISYNTNTSIDIAEKVGINSSRFLAVIPTLVATSSGGISDRMVSNWEESRYLIRAKTMYGNGERFYIGVTYFYV